MTFIVKCAPVLKEWNCCCCSCSMRAATIILGWFKMLYAISSLIYEIVCLSTYNTDLPATLGNTEDERRIYGFYKAALKEVLVTAMVVGIVNILLYGLLLFGIHKKKPGFMLPYIVLQLIAFILCCIAVIIGGIFVTASQGAVGLIIFVAGFIILAIMYFLWVIFYSYYRQLEEEKNPHQPQEVINYTYNVSNDQEKLADQLNHKAYPA